MLKLLENSQVTREQVKVERFDANWDIGVDKEGRKLIITASVEIDLASPETLRVLKQLKLSDSGKTFCAVATPTPKDFSDIFRGNIILNIPQSQMLPFQQFVEQRIKAGK